MKQATEKQINDFIKYRSQHIALVERIGYVVFGEDFSDHDFDKCTADAEALNILALRNAFLNGEYEPRGEIKDLINKLPGKHVKDNKHHPEFWDEDIKAKDWDEENPPVVHATKMPKKYLCEMACDWSAVAIKKNQPIFKWYNKVVATEDPRFVFTDNQKDYIIKCLTKIMNKIDEEHLYYPGITYDAKQIDPEREIMKESKDSELMKRVFSLDKAVATCEKHGIGPNENPTVGRAWELYKKDHNLKESVMYIVTDVFGRPVQGTKSENIDAVREIRSALAKKYGEVFRISKLNATVECMQESKYSISDEEILSFRNNEECIDSIRNWESKKNPFDILLEYDKRDFLKDIDELENQAVEQYKKDTDPIRRAVASGKITNCEDIKDLASDLQVPEDTSLFESLLRESILDVARKDYCSDLLNEEDKMVSAVREQILDTIDKWKEQINFDFNILEVYAKGSLLSKRYNDTSDLDVSIVTDMTKEQLDEIFDIIPKGQNIENTDHPLDFYVLTDGEHTPEKNLDNIYDVLNDKWIKRTEEYENEIPTDYLIQVANFLINGSIIALQNFESDKVMYEYYKGINSEEFDISSEELKEILEDKKRDLSADLDALNIALHMLSSFRQEAYDEDASPFRTVLEVESSNPHVTLNEQIVKIFEKFGIREKLRDAVKQCKEILGETGEGLETMTEEVSVGAFSGMIPENNIKIVEM